jgi:Flp pilus assembly protein TadG
MPINVPNLSTYASGDLNYISKLNSDNTAIENALNAINADLAVNLDGLGLAYAKEFYERRSSSSPSHGVLGPYSLSFTSSVATVTLSPNPASGVSKAVINGKRCEVSGALNVDVSNLVGGEIQVGVNYVDPNTMSIAAENTSNLSMDLPLYKFFLVSNTVQNLRRVPETLLWDNTLEQDRQQVPINFDVSLGSGSGNSTAYIQIPFLHTIHSMYAGGASLPSGVVEVSALSGTPGSSLGTLESLTVPQTSAGYVSLTTGSSSFFNAVWEENKVWELAYNHNGSHTQAHFGLRVFPAYNIQSVL